MDSATRVTNEIFEALGKSKVDIEQYGAVLRVIKEREVLRLYMVAGFVLCAAAMTRYALRADGMLTLAILIAVAFTFERWGRFFTDILESVLDESPLRSPWASLGRFVAKWVFAIGVWGTLIFICNRIWSDPHLQNERTASEEQVRVYNPSTEEEQTFTVTVHRSRSGDVVAWEFPNGGHIDVTSFVAHFSDESKSVKTDDGREWTFEGRR